MCCPTMGGWLSVSKQQCTCAVAVATLVAGLASLVAALGIQPHRDWGASVVTEALELLETADGAMDRAAISWVVLPTLTFFAGRLEFWQKRRSWGDGDLGQRVSVMMVNVVDDANAGANASVSTATAATASAAHPAHTAAGAGAKRISIWSLGHTTLAEVHTGNEAMIHAVEHAANSVTDADPVLPLPAEHGWLVMADYTMYLGALMNRAGALAEASGAPVWHDDFCFVLAYIKGGGGTRKYRLLVIRERELRGELQAAVDAGRLAIPTRRSIRAVLDSLLVAGARYSRAVQTDSAGELVERGRDTTAKLPSGVGRMQLIRAC